MDPYLVLGIKVNADPSTIKKAYYNLAKKHHPDRNRHIPDYSDDKFKEITEAYLKLTKTGNPKIDIDMNSFFYTKFKDLNIDFSKLFNEAKLFTQFFKESHPNGLENKKLTTDDINVNLRIDIQDIYMGVLRTITIPRNRKCKKCMGIGVKIYDRLKTCSSCMGNKYIKEDKDFIIDSSEKQITFFKESNEIVGKYTGHLNVRILAKMDAVPEMYILNNYDLLVQLKVDTNKYQLFGKEKEIEIKKEIPNGTMIPYKNMGLIISSPNERGTLFIQLLP
jgi:DnaJ-class molecular chaperone